MNEMNELEREMIAKGQGLLDSLEGLLEELKKSVARMEVERKEALLTITHIPPMVNPN